MNLDENVAAQPVRARGEVDGQADLHRWHCAEGQPIAESHHAGCPARSVRPTSNEQLSSGAAREEWQERVQREARAAHCPKQKPNPHGAGC